MVKKWNAGDTFTLDGVEWTITEVVDCKGNAEIRRCISSVGAHMDVKVGYDDKGEPWSYQDVTGYDKVTRRPFRPEDRGPKKQRPNGEVWYVDTLPDPDEVMEWIDKNGTKQCVYLEYNHDPGAPTLEDIVARALVHSYDTASRMFGIIIPQLEQRE